MKMLDTTRIRAALLGGMALFGPVLGGCNHSQHQDAGGRPLAAPPRFTDVARAHNENVAQLGQVWGAASVVIRSTREDGSVRSDQGEGNIMLMRPDRLALRVGKLSETLFWVGCDDQRYWLFDLASKPTTATAGRHDGPGRARSGLSGSLPTSRFADLLGISIIPEDEPGTTQWSDDGTLVGATFPIYGDHLDPAGFERVWFEAREFMVTKVEIYDLNRQCIVVSDLADPEYVQIAGQGDIGPRMNTRAAIGVEGAGVQVNLYMDRLEDGRERSGAPAKITPRSFQFEELVRALSPAEVIDADRTRPAPSAAKGAAEGAAEGAAKGAAKGAANGGGAQR